jgi:hypothetical protein
MQEKTTQEKIRELCLLTEEQLDWVTGGIAGGNPGSPQGLGTGAPGKGKGNGEMFGKGRF